ncbi:hypothetical protein ACFSKM_05410 [Ancylobacter dichloromethanicus]|uniref:Uncharacterized protein n=1 Tax=Ancylobacter dichloromethanicus TaxID=518825 RepID=A0A9W6MY46_9HYPH|nr:hypothetical protein GCM10017643_07910 [Ancylobacter dichloromethanicus]
MGDVKFIASIYYGVSLAVIALILHSCYRLVRLCMGDHLRWADREFLGWHSKPRSAGGLRLDQPYEVVDDEVRRGKH